MGKLTDTAADSSVEDNHKICCWY